MRQPPRGEIGHEQANPTNRVEWSGEICEGAEALHPRIYVASLSDYNAGILHGVWLDAAMEPEELESGVTAMLARSPSAARSGQPAEEWAIHDFDGFGAMPVGEYDSVQWVTRLAGVIRDHGLAAAAWAAHVGGEPSEVERFEEVFLGSWDSAKEYAEQLLDDFGLDEAIDTVVSQGLRPYVRLDVAGFARDLQLGGDITVIERDGGGVWVFGEQQ